MPSQSLANRIERAVARGALNLPAALLRILAGKPVVRDGQTLDVQTQMLLRLQRLRGKAAIGGRAVATERVDMNRQAQLLAPTTEHAVETRALQVAGATGALTARLYRPAGVTGTAGATVFYHGGGFVIGSLDSHDGICRALAERAACVVISVDYRLAPEHPAPACGDDAIAAFRDIAARAVEWGIDPARLAVAGDSAGANLATVVAQATRSDTPAPCFQLLFYPVTDFSADRESVRTYASGYLLDKAAMDWFRSHYIPQAMDSADPGLSPIHGDLNGLAPAIVITGGFDPLRDEGEAYGAAMQAAGVSVQVSRRPSMIHGFLNFAGGVVAADAALTEGAQALADAMKG